MNGWPNGLEAIEGEVRNFPISVDFPLGIHCTTEPDSTIQFSWLLFPSVRSVQEALSLRMLTMTNSYSVSTALRHLTRHEFIIMRFILKTKILRRTSDGKHAFENSNGDGRPQTWNPVVSEPRIVTRLRCHPNSMWRRLVLEMIHSLFSHSSSGQWARRFSNGIERCHSSSLVQKKKTCIWLHLANGMEERWRTTCFEIAHTYTLTSIFPHSRLLCSECLVLQGFATTQFRVN